MCKFEVKMPEKEKLALIPMDNTAVLQIRSNDSTLLIDTASELTKGYHWLNVLLAEVLEQRYIEEIEDENGNFHSRTKFHPLTMKLIEERRKTIDQIYTISGGEVRNEVKKELGKITAKMIFEGSRNPKTKEKYKENFRQIIEANLDEENESNKTGTND